MYEPRHKVRLAIKPGITGMWQVSGRSDITDFEEVVRLDKENESSLVFITGSGTAAMEATVMNMGADCIMGDDFSKYLYVRRGI